MTAPISMRFTAPGPLAGRIAVPGDKSISHRAVMLSSLAVGESRIEGLLEGEDVFRSAAAMRAFGATVEHLAAGSWRVVGAEGLREPGDIIDCGNAGTAVRLIMGAAAGFPLAATYTGDSSLRGRPMGRVLRPLSLMGASWTGREGPRLPISVRGGDLSAIAYAPPEPSAQVKSAVLLAALNARGETALTEAVPTRDHTERMLQGFGVELTTKETAQGRCVRIAGGQRLAGRHIDVPGDPSSAAFPLVAALITPGSEVTVRNVLLNPLRTGLITTLQEMGADIVIEGERLSGGERIGDITARFSQLTGVEVPPGRAASMIDEYPILAVAAAFASGETRMHGVGELRHKESDRIALMAAGLAACGVEIGEEPDALTVTGSAATNHPVLGAARIATGGDHRIAMSFLVRGLAAREGVVSEDAGMIATSFPSFRALMTGLGAQIADA